MVCIYHQFLEFLWNTTISRQLIDFLQRRFLSLLAWMYIWVGKEFFWFFLQRSKTKSLKTFWETGGEGLIRTKKLSLQILFRFVPRIIKKKNWKTSKALMIEKISNYSSHFSIQQRRNKTFDIIHSSILHSHTVRKSQIVSRYSIFRKKKLWILIFDYDALISISYWIFTPKMVKFQHFQFCHIKSRFLARNFK